jgi:hypothetical protein
MHLSGLRIKYLLHYRPAIVPSVIIITLNVQNVKVPFNFLLKAM